MAKETTLTSEVAVEETSYADVRGYDDVDVDAFQFSGTVEAPRLTNDLETLRIYYPVLF